MFLRTLLTVVLDPTHGAAETAPRECPVQHAWHPIPEPHIDLVVDPGPSFLCRMRGHIPHALDVIDIRTTVIVQRPNHGVALPIDSVIKEAVEREARDDGRRHFHLHLLLASLEFLGAVNHTLGAHGHFLLVIREVQQLLHDIVRCGGHISNGQALSPSRIFLLAQHQFAVFQRLFFAGRKSLQVLNRPKLKSWQGTTVPLRWRSWFQRSFLLRFRGHLPKAQGGTSS
mmetsp:Transcript_59479/g.97133  ORF Transcript_59479/g.97133 Transcript_59479/m.97133 type:complete len:228 (-) Transcript_59479:105-788(-)